MPNWEFKFTFRDNRMAAGFFNLIIGLRELAGYQCRRDDKARIQYSDYYFDTDDLGLERQGIVLRARQQKGLGTRLIMKKQAIGPNRELVYHKTAPFPLGIHGLKGLLDGEFPKQIETIVGLISGMETLRPIVTLEVRRQVVELNHPKGVVAQLHLDHIQAKLPGSETVAGEDYEVELKSDLETFPQADTLREYLQSVFGLIPITRSKLRRMTRLIRHSQECTACRKVILDMDPGVDDALALILALQSKELDVLGITVTGGNVSLNQTVRNACAVLTLLKKNRPSLAAPPVAPGESLREGIEDAANVHGPDGLGGVCDRHLDTDLLPGPDDRACDLFRRLMYAHEPGTITLIATGPLTNLARWIRECPEAFNRLKEVIVMGGVFFQAGNRSQAAEFNVHSDPKAARAVVEFCRRPQSDSAYTWRETLPLTFVGLDVTHQVRLRREWVEEASRKRTKNPLSSFVQEITAHYMDFYFRNEGLNGCYLHDPLTVAYAIDPSLCQAEQYHVEVEDRGEFTSGMTVADYRPTRLYKDKIKEVTWVCYKVDADRFERLFRERVLGIR